MSDRAFAARFPADDRTMRREDVNLFYASEYVLCYACVHVHSGKIAAECMLSNRSYRSMHIHFSVRQDFYGAAGKEACKQALTQIFEFTYAGAPYVETLVGLTPANNKLALRFIWSLGFKKLAEIPYAFRESAAVLSILEKSKWEA